MKSVPTKKRAQQYYAEIYDRNVALTYAKIYKKTQEKVVSVNYLNCADF